jgi:predicted amidophosphoribosyltransferase
MVLPTLVEGLLELIAPTTCAGCEWPGAVLCDGCDQRLERIVPERACPRCGAPECRRRCHECEGRAFPFEGARCAVVFDDPAPRIVVLHKEAAERRLAAAMARVLAPMLDDWASGWADAVVGVPAAPTAVARRAYDHGTGLGAALASELGLPAARPLRCLTARDQRELGRTQRAANVAFTCEPARRRGPSARREELASVMPPGRILLVDDVFTTGATAAAATRALLAAGSTEVRVAAFARVLRG